MVERDHRLDAFSQQGVDQVVVVIDAQLVGLIHSSGGEDACPREREAVEVDLQSSGDEMPMILASGKTDPGFLQDAHVLLVLVVAVASHVTRLILHHFAAFVREPVPNILAFAWNI